VRYYRQSEMDEIQLRLSAEQLSRIVAFLGYGDVSAKVWFVGIEEGLGDMTSEDIVRNLTARGGFDETMDLRDAHRQLLSKGLPIDVEVNPPGTQVWRWMAKIMRADNGEAKWGDRMLAREYVQFRLGRIDGETFLTELSPIPALKATDKSWLNWFAQEIPDLDSRLRRRNIRLAEVLRENDPALVICYGRKQAEKFAQLLAIEWRVVSAEISRSSDSRCLLLPFFGNGQMSRRIVGDLLRKNLVGPSR